MAWHPRAGFYLTSLLALALFMAYGVAGPGPAQAANAALGKADGGAQPSTAAVEAVPPTKVPVTKGFRFDASLVGSTLAPALSVQRYEPGLNFQLPDGATISVDYTPLKQEDFLSQEGLEGRGKAVVFGITGGRSDEIMPRREDKADRYNLSLFWRPSFLGGGSAHYLSGERVIMGIPERSVAMGVAANYRFSGRLIFDTTFEMNGTDGDRVVGGLHYLLPNNHLVSMQGRYVTGGDADIDEVPTVMFMYTIPFGVPRPVR
jgi:hypothetical protein